MPFALPILFLLDLLAAALAFAVVASVPAWRRSAITAPVFVFIAAPLTSVSFVLGFVSRWVVPILFALSATSLIAAYLAVLVCRFAFQTIAPRLEQWLGLRPLLILQAAILSGGALSLLVLLLMSPNLAIQIWRSGSHWGALATSIIGALSVSACVLALLRLRAPEQYQPKPLSDFLFQRIFNGRA